MPIARLDRDVVRKRGDLESVVSRIASGEARILVGTQMVTKGHDFPNVTLVVVLNADQGLFSTDFRAPERVAQTIIQVAGRAGRGTKPGEVLIQTEYPEHPLLAACSTRATTVSRAALAERAAAGWPPFAHVAALRASATDAARPRTSCAARAAGARRAGSSCWAGARRAWPSAPARYTRSCCSRRANARRCIARWTSGCARSKRSRRRATCAGRWTWIRSTCSSCRLSGLQPPRRAFSSPAASSASPAIARLDALTTRGRRRCAWRLHLGRGDPAVTAMRHSPDARQARPRSRRAAQREAAAVVAVLAAEREPDLHGLRRRCVLASCESSAAPARRAPPARRFER
jgi:superfamily II DNA/RNA helicase